MKLSLQFAIFAYQCFQMGGEIFSARGPLDIYSIICGPYEIINLEISLLQLLNFVYHLWLPWQGQTKWLWGPCRALDWTFFIIIIKQLFQDHLLNALVHWLFCPTHPSFHYSNTETQSRVLIICLLASPSGVGISSFINRIHIAVPGIMPGSQIALVLMELIT